MKKQTTKDKGCTLTLCSETGGNNLAVQVAQPVEPSLYKQTGNCLATAYIRTYEYVYLGWFKLKTIAFSSICAMLGLKHKPIFHGVSQASHLFVIAQHMYSLMVSSCNLCVENL